MFRGLIICQDKSPAMHQETFSVLRHAQMMEVSCKDKTNCWENKTFGIPVDTSWPCDNASTVMAKETSCSTELIYSLGFYRLENELKHPS